MIMLAVMLAVALAGIAARTGTSAVPNPSQFSTRIDNPWFPLEPGSTYIYRGVKDGRPSREVLKVTHETKPIGGVPAVVVSDRLYVDGRLAERTTDWYSQDKRGNVWYFGEATAELDRQGRVTSTEGSWQAGRDGARAGIYMPARPNVGQSFRQEFYKGHAEDHFRVLSLHSTVQVPYTSSRQALLTREWTPLEPGAIDHKLYVRGVGTVLEQSVKGGNERNELVSFSKG